MVVDSGDTTTQALARNKSAAARIVRSAVPGSGVRRILSADGVQGSEGIELGHLAHIVDRSADYEFRRSVLRSAIGIDNNGAFAGKSISECRLEWLV